MSSISRRVTSTAVLLLSGAVGTACRHQSAAAPPTPAVAAWPPDEYCWWNSIHTALPVDSVGARFTRALAAAGLTDIVSRRIGDTVLVRGGPTELADARGRAVFASRAVAYQLGDSTRFRWYSSITPGPAAAASADSSVASGRLIGFCGQVGKGVAISGMTTRDPTAADSIPVWNRVP